MHTAALETVVTEAHDLLLARAEQIREHNRRNGELAAGRDALQARLTDLQAELLKCESEFKEVDHVRTIYAERNAALARAFTAKGTVLALAEQANAALNERIGALEDRARRPNGTDRAADARRQSRLTVSVEPATLPRRHSAAFSRIAAEPKRGPFDLPQCGNAPVPASVLLRHPGGGRALFVMPYRVNRDLPSSVRNHLPDHAQDTYREAFNHAFTAHADELDREQRAHMIAWAAVKRSYVKAGDTWVPRLGTGA